MHKLELLASAIAEAEGFWAGGPGPAANHNPGGLRATPLPRRKDKAGFTIFSSDVEGWMGLLTQLMLYALRGMTLRQAVYTATPPRGSDGGNHTEKYLNGIIHKTGIAGDTKLSSLFTFTPIP